jgi:hypothetical protein
VLGVEGGASLFDRDGALQKAVAAYVCEHPGASFEEVRERCFPGRDGEINLFALSPRHFEAVLTGTCQLLVEGEYNGVLRPWEHYVPIRRDWANLDEVLDAVQDDATVTRIVERAYRDLVASGRWSYASFVRGVEASVVEHFPMRPLGPMQRLLLRLLALRDGAQWRWAHFEASETGRRWTARRRWLISLPRRAIARMRRAGGRTLRRLGLRSS